ncbi:condensation domain-containing protein [Streptomyces sp. V2]|uniref:Condensation domain-containing protein n=1 Tax=Streptomyces niveiscabiei TaxID=164115 RepID=A0ABW9I5M0_9ACTN|nr:condensation domain-containing protein [Streptomyces sp. V2]
MTTYSRAAAATHGSTRTADPGILPASSRQDWCWHWMRSHTEDSTPLEIPHVLLLRGPLDVGALRDALAEIEMRHEALRMRLAGHAGAAADATWPGQRLLPAPSDLNVLSAGSEDGQPEVLHTVAQRLDLTDRMIRHTLVSAAHGEHHLVTQFHHLAVDAMSHDLFQQQLAAAYAARIGAGGGPSADKLVPFSYVDMIQREQSAQVRADHRRRAADLARAVQAHGAERPLPGRGGAEMSLVSRFAGIPLTLSSADTENLNQWCREQRTTPHNALLALLARGVADVYERDRLVASLYMHGRTTPASRQAIGLMCNVLPVPLDLGSRDPSGLARQVGERILETWDAIDVPLSVVADEAAVRTGSEAFYRAGLSHLEFRTIGDAGQRRRNTDAPLQFGPGLSARYVTHEAPDRGMRFATRRQALQSAQSLYATVDLAGSAITGSLWFDEQYHDAERLVHVVDAFHAGIRAIGTARLGE